MLNWWVDYGHTDKLTFNAQHSILNPQHSDSHPSGGISAERYCGGELHIIFFIYDIQKTLS